MPNLQLLGTVSPGDLSSARKVLHNAVQLIASAGQALAEPKPDDSHRSMSWEPDSYAFRGVELRGCFSVRVRAVEFIAELVDSKGSAFATVKLEERPLIESLRTLQEAMPVTPEERAFDFATFDENLPDTALLQVPLKLPDLPHRTELALHYAHAYRCLERLSEHHTVSEIRTWPHHFDMAVIEALAADSQVGIGLSPGDGSYAEPYWYVTSWPLPAGAEGTPLPEPWKWHTDDWTGIILPTSKLLEASGDPDQLLDASLEECLQIARALVEPRR